MRVLVLIGLFSLFYKTYQKQSYSICIDAGSSGTRAYSYSFSDLLSTKGGLRQLCKKTDMPKISSYGSEPGLTPLSFLKRDLTNLLNSLWTGCTTEGSMNLPSGVPQKEITIYFGATAGMRLLRIDHIEEILGTVRTTLVENFKFGNIKKDGDNSVAVSVLSGEEEAIFGWIHVQFLLNSFDFNVPQRGALDMGGASTQLSFIPDEAILGNKWNVKYDEYVYNLYTHSFFYYGQGRAFSLSKAWVIEKYGPTEPVPHPCLWNGAITDPKDDGDFHKSYKGTGDMETCYVLVHEITHRNAWCAFNQSSHPCAFDAQYIPNIPPEKEFYAFSGYFYVAQGLRLVSDDQHITPPDMPLSAASDAIWEICSNGHDWNWATNYSYYAHKKGLEEILLRQCFTAMFTIRGVLIDGYNIPKTSTQIRFADEIEDAQGNSASVSWVIGMLLYHKNVLEVGTTEFLDLLHMWQQAARSWQGVGVAFMVMFFCLMAVLCLALALGTVPWVFFLKNKNVFEYKRVGS